MSRLELRARWEEAAWAPRYTQPSELLVTIPASDEVTASHRVATQGGVHCCIANGYDIRNIARYTLHWLQA